MAGVPQGSCISPFLYSIFTNDLPVRLNAQVSLFTDDTVFHTHQKTLIGQLSAYKIQYTTRKYGSTIVDLLQYSKRVAIHFNRKIHDPLRITAQRSSNPLVKNGDISGRNNI